MTNQQYLVKVFPQAAQLTKKQRARLALRYYRKLAAAGAYGGQDWWMESDRAIHQAIAKAIAAAK